MEIYKKHRPTKFKQVVGQTDAVRVLRGAIEGGRLPHALLMVGPSGVGKTTLARILAAKLECGPADLNEINAADFRGIDTVREIRDGVNRAPMSGKVRIYIIDECHQLVNTAQNALLKVLEDTPAHAYFILCTTDPHKLLPTIITRCTQVRLKPIGAVELSQHVMEVAKTEGKPISEELADKIVLHSEGSGRKALVILESVLHLDEDKQMSAIEASDLRPKAIALAQELISPRCEWRKVQKILKGLTDEDPEQLRYMILGYASSVLLGNSSLHARASFIIQVFENNFYDSKRAGLINSSYEVATAGKKR